MANAAEWVLFTGGVWGNGISGQCIVFGLGGGVLNLLQGHPQKFIIIFTAKKSPFLTKHHFCSKYNIRLHPAPASY
jgi:hypothetical protein